MSVKRRQSHQHHQQHHQKQQRGGREVPIETWQVERMPTQQEWRGQDRIQDMKRLARSGAPVDLLWDIQQNQLRQHQIVFANLQRGPHQHRHVEEIGQEIMRRDQLIRAKARGSKCEWILDRYCRTSCSYEATLALTRELYLVQLEIQRHQGA